MPTPVRDKSARFGASVPSDFVAKRRAFLPSPAPSKREVTFGGVVGMVPRPPSNIRVF
mgnify:CR=1 FL=1